MHPTVSIVVRQLKCPVTTWQTERAPGDVIGVALPALHADPQVWPDPSAFDPERFLGRRPSPTEYSPFGYGHRRCPGSSFAALELAIALGTILTNVELRIPGRDSGEPGCPGRSRGAWPPSPAGRSRSKSSENSKEVVNS